MMSAYTLKNLPHRLRGAKAELCHLVGLGVLAELSAVVVRADGRVESLGVVSRRLVTNNGVGHIASAFTNTTEAEAMNYHDCGTGVAAEAAADSALGTPYGGSRAVGTQSNPSANQYRTVGTVSFTSTLAITEHGVFSAAAAGTLLDRSVFAAINVVSGDSIQFTYTITFTAGG